jgi:hypothetical protein
MSAAVAARLMRRTLRLRLCASLRGYFGQEVAPMRRIYWYPLLMLMLAAAPSSAIQLHWSSGSQNLTFTSATRCTLVVQADSAEVRMPAEWRLLWAADSSSIQFVAIDSLEACLLDEAQVSRIDAPATAADSAANLVTAHFCSDESNATVARQVVDLPAGGRGRLKVVALDPNDPDSSQVIESNEVKYNGGVEGDYPSVVLHASSVHQSLKLQVTAVGTGLVAAKSMNIMAPDSSWTLPLTVTLRSDHSLTGTASVAAVLPVCQAAISTEGGASSAASISADTEPTLDITGGGACSVQYFETLLGTPPPLHGYTIQPKDFAFAPGFVDTATHRYALHLFYIRHNYWYDAYYDQNGYHPAQPDLNEKNIGHVWISDSTFTSWHGPAPGDKPDTVALRSRAGKFDELHVWAPTIVRRGPTFYVFYTGVRNEGGRMNQRIGVATTTDLDSLTPADAPVLTAPEIPWSKKDPSGSPYFGAQQLRDPFVMEYPVGSGHWLMYFVAEDSLRAPKMAVGVATSNDLVTWAVLNDPFSSTERPTFQGATNVVESPHIFPRNGQWWMPYTVNNDKVFFETTASADPTDTVASHWTSPIWLQGASQEQPPQLQFWHATEHLGSGPSEWLAAWNDNASSIEIMGLFAADNPAVDSLKLACPPSPPTAGIGDNGPLSPGLRLLVSSLRWGTPEVALGLELPSRMPVRLAVYDISGRRHSTLLDRELPAGVTNVKWDGRDDSGDRVASGMYYVRLTCARGARVSRVVILR